jgi:hypothetical protein
MPEPLQLMPEPLQLMPEPLQLMPEPLQLMQNDHYSWNSPHDCLHALKGPRDCSSSLAGKASRGPDLHEPLRLYLFGPSQRRAR